MNFSQQKSQQLSKSDKSNKGNWDKKISKLCNKINKSNNYYTTSSCSGRIILLKGGLKKQKDIFLFRTHDKITFEELKKALSKITYDQIVDFSLSTCILHIACSNLEAAQTLVNKAKESGWKHSGIMSTKKRIMVELLSTEKINFPIMNKKQLLVNDNYLKLIIKESNIKLEKIWDKIKRLENLF